MSWAAFERVVDEEIRVDGLKRPDGWLVESLPSPMGFDILVRTACPTYRHLTNYHVAGLGDARAVMKGALHCEICAPAHLDRLYMVDPGRHAARDFWGPKGLKRKAVCDA